MQLFEEKVTTQKINDSKNKAEMNESVAMILASTPTWRFENHVDHSFYWQGLTVAVGVGVAAAMYGITAATSKSKLVDKYTLATMGFVGGLSALISATAPDFNNKVDVYYDIYNEMHHHSFKPHEFICGRCSSYCISSISDRHFKEIESNVIKKEALL